jgi:hypothetical protein
VELGRYVDGRALDYDGTTGSFAIGGAPATAEQVAGYSRAGQIAWAGAETSAWFEAAFPVPTAAPPAQASIVPTATTPADTGGGMALRVVLASFLVLLVLGGTGLWWAWSSGAIQRVAQLVGLSSPTAAGVASSTAQPDSDRAFYDGQVAQATAVYDADPNIRTSIVDLGNAYYDRAILDLEAPTAEADWRSAISYYTEVLGVEPNDSPTRTDLGSAYYYLSEYDSAALEFQTVLDDDPDFEMARACLGLVLEAQGDTAGAVSLYEQVAGSTGADDLTERARVLARERLRAIGP